MAGDSVDATCGKRSSANGVDERVEDHERRGAVVYELGAVFVCRAGVWRGVQEDEDAEVEYDG